MQTIEPEFLKERLADVEDLEAADRSVLGREIINRHVYEGDVDVETVRRGIGLCDAAYFCNYMFLIDPAVLADEQVLESVESWEYPAGLTVFLDARIPAALRLRAGRVLAESPAHLLLAVRGLLNHEREVALSGSLLGVLQAKAGGSDRGREILAALGSGALRRDVGGHSRR